MALAAAVAFECVRSGRRYALATVDHRLQNGSDEQAARVAGIAAELGFDPVFVAAVHVAAAGGPEAAARAARYAALERLRGATGVEQSSLVLLGHTADDQAETVLLGLGRGSGPRSIAGMRPVADGYLRPLLGLRRSDTVRACSALGLPVWQDPHNQDARFRRVRLRTEALPLLEDILGGGVARALARTAELMAEDLDALEELAGLALVAATSPGPGCAIAALAEQPVAIVSRVLKRWAESAGCPPLSAVHVTQLTRLVRQWHGQGPIELPGGYRVVRTSGRLELEPSRPAVP
jgi:tRNA(Ile)-lysidine synthase